MGDKPIQVGESFFRYDDVKQTLIKRSHTDAGFSINDGYSSNSNSFSIMRGAYMYADGYTTGKTAQIYADWGDGNCSIYSTKYKPESLKYKPNPENPTFTTIYDWSDKYNFYVKATDINGDGYVSDGEITYFNNYDELMKDL
jgi:hypothetical protein